jgi:non-specific serine/threonine protein kinase
VQVRHLLASRRFVALVGAGGIGKTRLARHTAASLAPGFPDGVFSVDLSALRHPHLVPAQIADALGLRHQSEATAWRMLVEELRSKRMLLVVDSMDRVLDAGPALGELVDSAPGLHVLVTSRERLNVSGAGELELPPLSMDEATKLFATRAADAHKGFVPTKENAAAIREICKHLDGLPLALELAAARVKVLAPEQIRERLLPRLRLLTHGPRGAGRAASHRRPGARWQGVRRADLLGG